MSSYIEMLARATVAICGRLGTGHESQLFDNCRHTPGSEFMGSSPRSTWSSN